MEAIRQWAMTACFAVSVAGIITMLAPKNNLGKLIGLLTSIFILICFLLPILNLDYDVDNWDISLSQEQSDEIAGEIDKISKNYVYKQASDNIYVLIEDALAELGVRAQDIDISISDENNDTEVSADVYIDEAYYSAAEAAKNKLEAMGIKTSIILFDETQNIDERNEK